MNNRPCVLVLKRIENLVKSHHQSSNEEAGRMMEALHQCINTSQPQCSDEKDVNFPLIVIATTEKMSSVTSGISSLMLHQVRCLQLLVVSIKRFLLLNISFRQKTFN